MICTDTDHYVNTLSTIAQEKKTKRKQIFQIKTDPNQAIRHVCTWATLEDLWYRCLKLGKHNLR